jgi:hypothetical protein
MVGHLTLYPPWSVGNMFENRLTIGFKLLIMVGAFVVIWSLYLYINDYKFYGDWHF